MTDQYVSRLWSHIPPDRRMVLAYDVGWRFSRYKQDTKTIADALAYPESTIYSALHAWRERQRKAA
jgi:hypothetical protein